MGDPAGRHAVEDDGGAVVTALRLDAVATDPRPFLVEGADTLSFAQTVARARAVGAALERMLGGRRLGLVAGADIAGVLAVLGALDRDLRPVLVHPRWSAAERARFAERLGIQVIEADRIVPIETDDLEPREPEPEDIAVGVPTSGSSGSPQAVLLSHRALWAAAQASAANLGWCDDDRWLLSIPVAHVGGLSIVTRCFWGRRPVVLPEALKGGFTAVGFGSEVRRGRVTLASLVPTMMQRLVSDRDFVWPAPLRAVLLGGAATPPCLREAIVDRGYPVLTTYGLTEAAAQVATQPLGTRVSRDGAVGPPLPGVEVSIRDGRILVRSPSLLTRTEPTGQTPDAEGWWDTGDLGEWSASGWLRIRGRRSEMIISGGENVFPAEVEQALSEHPSVHDVLVTGMPSEEWGEVVGAALVLRDEGRGLAPFVRERLSSFRRPRIAVRVVEIPKGPTGKPDRRAVARLLAESGRSLEAVLREP